jgi:hypothetical protein
MSSITILPRERSWNSYAQRAARDFSAVADLIELLFMTMDNDGHVILGYALPADDSFRWASYMSEPRSCRWGTSAQVGASLTSLIPFATVANAPSDQRNPPDYWRASAF